MDEKKDKYSAPALSKGLDILEHLASEPRPQKKADIARALDRSISEIFRMLAVLEQREYVACDEDTERYSLTTKLFEIAHRHPPIRRLSSIAGDTMQQLAREVNQSVHLSILRDTHILVIAQVDSPGDNVTSVRLGARIPLAQTASGAVLTAQLNEASRKVLDETIKADRQSPIKMYMQNRTMAKDKGFCECPSMVVEGVLNISVPVRDHAGEVVAALTIPFIKRLNKTHRLSRVETRKALIAAGRNLSHMLGGEASRQ